MVKVREFGVFTAIGTTAAGIQLGIVATTVPLGLPPLFANVAGFLVSFAFGFVGHSRWTFPAAGRSVPVALQRFAAVSALGFGLNEAAYAGALTWTDLDYRLALLAVLASFGLLKLLASKHWAFA